MNNRLNVLGNHLAHNSDRVVVKDRNICYTPSQERMVNSLVYSFLQNVNESYSTNIRDYESLHKWSVANLDKFWNLVWDFCGVRGYKGSPVLLSGSRTIDCKFFPHSRFNFTENCISRVHRTSEPVIIYNREHIEDSTVSGSQLHAAVHQLAYAMKSLGIRKGDRVCAVLPNTPEAIMCMLATLSIGAVWSSVSPDFGYEGLLERFGQISPVLLFYVDTFYNKNQLYDIRDNIGRLIAECSAQCRTFSSVHATKEGIEEFTRLHATTTIPVFEPTNFNDAAFIMFSSGTTGKPKCIVHRHGVLLQLMKEHQLHCDIKPGDRVFYYTTTAWMMWNWLAGSLASGAVLLLYDGNPTYPDDLSLFRFARKNNCSFFGVSAKYIDSLRQLHNTSSNLLNLDFVADCVSESIRTIASTGSPLVEESFDFIYSNFVKPPATLSVVSICGGTDILSCFVLGSPLKPVKRGFAQCVGLGMDVRVAADKECPNEGQMPLTELPYGEKGELVCCSPFPSMPIGFWGDAAPSCSLYRKSYFALWGDNVWQQGDHIAIDRDGHVMVFGRSDCTIKPGGVRIGTADIYRVVSGIGWVKDCVCCGVQVHKGSEEVALFVVLKTEGEELTPEMKSIIKTSIQKSTTRHHVPKYVESVPDVPRTRNGKVAEIAAKQAVNGDVVKSVNSLANPEVLTFFVGLGDKIRGNLTKPPS